MASGFVGRIGKGILEFIYGLNNRTWLPHLKHCGKDLRLDRWLEVSDPQNVSIGDGVIIRGGFIQGTGGVTIGNYTHMGINLSIYSANHRFDGATSLPYDNELVKKPVTLEDFVTLGANVVIIPGVTIAEGAIVGVGSVVTRDVPPLAVVGGNPAKVIRYRNKEEFEKLKEQKKFIWGYY